MTLELGNAITTYVRLIFKHLLDLKEVSMRLIIRTLITFYACNVALWGAFVMNSLFIVDSAVLWEHLIITTLPQ